METPEIAKCITKFIDRHYPKGNRDRGFAMVVLSLFLNDVNDPSSKYKITKK